MYNYNKFQTIVCLLGLAVLAVCHCAEIPKPETTSSPTSAVIAQADGQQGAGYGWSMSYGSDGDDEDEGPYDDDEDDDDDEWRPEMEDGDDYGDDYEDDDDFEGEDDEGFAAYYIEDEEESPEDELEDLAEEHYDVRADCANMRAMIEEAKQQNATAPVDPDLQQAYTECQQYLSTIRADLARLTAEIQAKDNEVA